VLIIRTRHVAVPHELMADSELWRVMRKQDVVSPTALNPYMQRGSADVEFLPGLEPGPDEVVVEKTTPSLFVGTSVSAVLHAAGVRTLALAGVATDIGIDFTARHALALGFFPVVIEDAVGAYSDSAQSTGLQSLRRFAFCADTMTAIDSWRVGHV
jgi:nicotinamidase-related amidase